MIYSNQDAKEEVNEDFVNFQKVLKGVGYPKIPQNIQECWKIDSYDLCQRYLQKYYIFPEALQVVSKFVPIEKYYWMTVTMFPSNHLGYNNGETIIPAHKLNEEDKATFVKK